METMRVFIAIDIGDEIRAKLDDLQRKLKKVHANVRWVKPRGIHLTLVFLGDVPSDRIDVLKTALGQACQGQAAFDLEAVGTGTFGKPRSPRVVWVGTTDCPPLTTLQKKIAHGLHDTGFEFDNKPFSPHLTLGRVKGLDRHTSPLLERIEKYENAPLGQTHVDGIELIQSVLTPHGAEYTVLHRVALP